MSDKVEAQAGTGLLGLEHVGMTCRDVDQTMAFYCGLLGLKLALRKTNPGGEVIFLDTGAGMLEIACPNADISGPRPAFFNEMLRRVVFFRDPDGVLVELIERADWRRQ
jgi:glyoxylase I family protein